jgi:hypothetical protein
MKPVEQTRYGFPDGNCFAACVASILELPLEETDFIGAAAEDWWTRWLTWLAERNLTLFHWPHEEGNFSPPGWSILGTLPPHLKGTAPDKDYEVGHAVVAFNGQPVWNPNPTFTDLGPWNGWYAFGVLDPRGVSTVDGDET